MQLLHLYYFKFLAENEHLSKTAHLLHISPPALSATISKLENELGTQLFDHVGRQIKLNESGKVLYCHVRNIFSELDDISREFQKDTPIRQDTINVAVSAQSLWNGVIGEFMKLHPMVKVNHSILRMDQMQEQETIGAFDLIITDVNDIKSKSWEHEFIIEDPPVLLVQQSHPFAHLSSISLYDAREEPFVALSKGYSSREFFENACKQAGFIPHVVAEADYMLRTQLVENGTGISFSSVLGARAIKSSSIRMVRVKYPPNPRLQTVFWKNGVSHSPSILQFRDFLIEYYKKLQLEVEPFYSMRL